MTGLLSACPSQSAIRLSLGGSLLSIVQSTLLLLMPDLEGAVRALIWFITSLSALALLTALIGLPDPPPYHWRRRHGG